MAMELGQRIKQARLEAGLSQRQLCGEEITRNMLSQIENGSASPSMATLRLFASRLGKTVSYFLEEDTVTSPNQAAMASAREAYAAKDISAAVRALDCYKTPDPVFDQEYRLLTALCRMEQARQAIADEKLPYAAALLKQAAEAGKDCAYYGAEMERRRLLLLAETRQESFRVLAASIPVDDEELLLRAEAALLDNRPERCIQLLNAAEHKETPRWNLLRADAGFAQRDYTCAAAHYAFAEESFPKQTVPRLEICYRELGDFKKAYEYALKQR